MRRVISSDHRPAARASASLMTPSRSASSPARRIPSDCMSSILSSATPSLSNSFWARATRTLWSCTPAIASATSRSRYSVGRIRPVESVSRMPSASSASYASPVPAAASAARRVKRCSAMSIVCVETPASSPA